MLQNQITALQPHINAHVLTVHCALLSAAPCSLISRYQCKYFIDQYK